ncbi:hypothetical protein ACWD6R_30065 [Streptomyces sp. NPDC005151]
MKEILIVLLALVLTLLTVAEISGFVQHGDWFAPRRFSRALRPQDPNRD